MSTLQKSTEAGLRPAAASGTLALHDCRLEHPLKIASVAARCGVLQVAENPAESSGRTIGLHVAVVPALNRRSRSAPLFLLAGGPAFGASRPTTTRRLRS